MHSEAELAQKLRRRGFAADDIAAVVASCVRLGYLDDAAYAAALVRRRSSHRGSAAMAAELRAKGVGREAAALALGSIDRDAEIASAQALIERYASIRSELTPPELLARLGARLQRRGYSPQVIREACRRYSFR